MGLVRARVTGAVPRQAAAPCGPGSSLITRRGFPAPKTNPIFRERYRSARVDSLLYGCRAIQAGP